YSLLIISTALSFAGLAQHQPYQAPVHTDTKRAERLKATEPVISKMIATLATENHFPGYAFGILLDGQLIYSGAGGYANIEKQIKADTRSMFRIASMSKSFTAMAILKLRDEGKLKLDDPVYNYIPEL
ncbi:serine hydrolase domain-containing protein, partial [Salmonella enterica]|uniref:serine hydrolase domain-containing protein n=1 Tax=Salmonella enterica TaxID=28901 RepID=UPI003D2A9D76